MAKFKRGTPIETIEEFEQALSTQPYAVYFNHKYTNAGWAQQWKYSMIKQCIANKVLFKVEKNDNKKV